MIDYKTIEELTNKRLIRLKKILTNQKRFLIVLHNNPDPDAIASGFALSYLAQSLFDIQTTIAYGGIIGRAENLAMVKQLKIPLKKINSIRLKSYDRVALIDTQPGAGNNSLPKDVKCDVVIDHHPLRAGLKCDFLIIEPNIGSTATMLIEWIKTCELIIPTDLATALSYAIRSETQDLGRETTTRDIKAYFTVYPLASMRKLAKIVNPKLPHSYFISLTKTLNRTMVYRNLIFAHLGNIPIPEIVAEMADMLLRHERISWSLCTGRYNNTLYLSLRTSNPKGRAGKFIKQLVKNRNNAGGHDLFAGGMIDITKLSERAICEIEEKISSDFARLRGYEDIEWKPLFNE